MDENGRTSTKRLPLPLNGGIVVAFLTAFIYVIATSIYLDNFGMNFRQFFPSNDFSEREMLNQLLVTEYAYYIKAGNFHFSRKAD